MITIFGKMPESLGMLHFIGIGGVGMSALAEYLADAGYHVQGSDVAENANIQRLRQKGVDVFIGHHPGHLDKAFRVVVSTAIREDNIEYIEAKNRGIRIVHRSELLAEVIRGTKSVAVSGTHGKTSTTSMVFHVLGFGGLNPGVVTGGIIRGIKTGAVLGGGQHFVAEADESDGSFTRFSPEVAVVTNMDPEHMDHYQSPAKMKAAYVEFIDNIRAGGAAVLCADHPESLNLKNACTHGQKVLTYGFSNEADVRAEGVKLVGRYTVFDVILNGERHQDVHLNAIGNHNVQNALAALSVGYYYGLPMSAMREGLKNYQGVRRRFQVLGESNHGVTVVDDYAHHPVEIETTLQGARELYQNRRIIAVMQPHRYSRLQELMEDFSACCSYADEVMVVPVHPAGELPITGVNHEALAEKMATKFEGPIHLVSSEADMIAQIQDHAQSGDVVICMGAGSISVWAHHLMQALK